MQERSRLRPLGTERRCPLCRESCPEDAQRVHVCGGCQTTYHHDCAVEMGGCATLGCRLAGMLPESATAWACRYCHRPIESDLTRRLCRCRAYLHQACYDSHQASCDPSLPAARRPGGSPPVPLRSTLTRRKLAARVRREQQRIRERQSEIEFTLRDWWKLLPLFFGMWLFFVVVMYSENIYFGERVVAGLVFTSVIFVVAGVHVGARWVLDRTFGTNWRDV